MVKLLELYQQIREGMYDSLVTSISRDIVNEFKKHLDSNNKSKTIKIPSEWPLYDGSKEIINIVVTFKKDKNMSDDFDIGGFAAWDDKQIDIDIFYNPEDFPYSLSKLIGGIKETLTHEVEHWAQYFYNRPEDIKTSIQKTSNIEDLSFFDYLTFPDEIPAFVRGLYRKAKYNKQPLDVEIDDFFEDWFSKYDNPNKEMRKNKVPQIKKIWIEWAKKNLPAAQYSK
jgi:hypothetical protein